MIQLEELHQAGYGLFIYLPDVFVNFLKAEKCRARKLLTYFDRTESAENDNLTKGDNEKTIFDIPWYIESTREQSKD